jgi:UDP-N-acetyl-D-galactosamine dehydrogenase
MEMTVEQLRKSTRALVMGCGYVGHDLIARLNDEGWDVIGYDTNPDRIEELKSGKTFEQNQITIYTSDLEYVKKFKVGIIFVCVPTPIYEDTKPDMRCVNASVNTIWHILKDLENPEEVVIIYESTYTPGTTRTIRDGLKLLLKKEIKVGYSPERIMPGGYEPEAKKICGADDLALQELMADIYRPLYGDVFKCTTEEAEAIKLIENSQKDVNIAFMNVMSCYLYLHKINPIKVWKGLKTRADALNYTPGLVGGHCIPVDPWYLYHDIKFAQFPIIEVARTDNDYMPRFIDMVVFNKALQYLDENIVIQQLGLTYKPNIGDIRNSGALEMFSLILKKELDNLVELEKMGRKITAYYDDPYIEKFMVDDWTIHRNLEKANLVILAVPHKKYRTDHATFMETYFMLDSPGVFMDLYGVYEDYEHYFKNHKIQYWRL